MGTYGTLAVDHEIRCNFDKLRRDRLDKAKSQLRKDGLGALLSFEMDHIRYITGTKLGDWNFTLRQRYALLFVDHDPILFEMGSAIPTKRMLSPFMKDIRPVISDMKGIQSPEGGNVKRGVAQIVDILREYGLQDAPLGMDIPQVSWVLELQASGIKVVDGLQSILTAEATKTAEEIYLMEQSAAAVDAAYYRILEFAKPGVRENEIAALIHSTCIEMGAEMVHESQVISGNRANPHPHDFSDRVLRPGDMLFMDIVNDFMGYKTCYYRTMVCGKPTEAQKRIYKKCYDMLMAAISICKAGITTADIIAKWPTAKEMGFKNEDEAFLLQIAHGIGITHWGKPAIVLPYSVKHPEVIEENMVIAFETYYAEGDNAARIEDEVVITKDGHRIITKFPSDVLMSTWNW